MATAAQRQGLAAINEPANATRKLVYKTVTATLVAGAAAGSFDLPVGSKVVSVHAETPTTIPGTPTNTNLRLGSAASGQQFVADVDVKAQGWLTTTLLYAARNAVSFYYTLTSSGGTAGSQVGPVLIIVAYLPPNG